MRLGAAQPGAKGRAANHAESASADSGHPAEEKAHGQNDEHGHNWLLSGRLSYLLGRVPNLIGTFAVGLPHCSSGLPGLALRLRSGVPGQAAGGILDFANRVFQGAFKTILINHGFRTSQ